MVDGDKPAMGFIYEAMDQAKEAIKTTYGDKRQKYLPLWKIIDDRWNKQLHRPLHASWLLLKPKVCNFKVFKLCYSLQKFSQSFKLN
jgi:hypothetical protein